MAGFLAASASFSQDHAYARLYLAPQWARTWNPGWAVTVVSGQPVPKLVLPKYINKPANNPRVTSVGVSGVQLASISANGQYQQVVSGPARKIRFSLTKVNGQWRITDPPNRLLLSNSEFHRVYQPRNLYYFDSTGKILVPDPVFVPLQATSTDLATNGWSRRSASSRSAGCRAPPRRASPRHQAAVPGQDRGLRGRGQPGRHDRRGQLGDPQERGRAAGVDADQRVVRPVRDHLGAARGQRRAPADPGFPQRDRGAQHLRHHGPGPVRRRRPVLRGRDKTVQSLPASGAAQPAPVPGQAGTGAVPMTAIAVSPVTSGTPALAGIAANGRDV